MGELKINSGVLPVDSIIRSPRDSYIVKSILGAGGFGITYKVLRLSDGKTFAMKEYFPDKLCERGDNNTMSYLKTNAQTIEIGMADFITEATRLNKQNIQHPNIVAIDEVFKANNTAYYVMEYIDGFNLRQYMKHNHNRPLTVEQSLSVMRPVLQAVALIHQHKLTHLDLKHENIILTHEEDGSLRPVIIDFGQSKHYDKKGKATSKLTNAGCSEGFAPPEQYLGLYTFTPQADVYALCATLLYLLTARQPVKSSEISASIITGMLDDNIPDRVRNAIIAGMRRDKDDRTQSVKSLADDLGIDISSQSHEGNVTHLLKINRPGFDLKKLVKPAIGVAFVIGVAGAIYWFANKPKSSASTPSASTPSELLTAAIQDKDEASLKKFVVLDSIRAYLPYSELLLQKGDYEWCIWYARHALATSDSIRAAEIIELANNKLRQPDVINNTDSPDDSIGIIYVDETDAEKFRRAIEYKDYDLMLSLANSGVKEAYYPMALYYYNAGDMKQSESWAKKAISANVDRSKAESLLKKIKSPTQEPVSAPSGNAQNINAETVDREEQLQQALKDPLKGNGTLMILAEYEHYVPAYYPYARFLLQQGKSGAAKEYLKMSIEMGVNVPQSQQLLESLAD